MADGARDWLSAENIDFSNYFSEAIDIHHIFPIAWCKKNNISKNDYNSIINKTPLSSRTNRIVGGDAPSRYLQRIQKRAGVDVEEFEEILKSHLLSPQYLYADDFEGFFNHRKELILQKIEEAMNKKIPRGEVQMEEGFYDYEEEEELD